jgi:hypothetical protein
MIDETIAVYCIGKEAQTSTPPSVHCDRFAAGC